MCSGLGLLVDRDVNVACQERHGFPTDADPFSAVFTKELATPCRYLASEESFLLQAIGPIRDQRAVNGAGDRIFRDSKIRREIA